ncbi:hypothetical protein [Paenibacillus ihuae]|uniref:hypothetical protein n=1 Tax=Paenibacillus ihuae TaxID=1232431 RepID=UPI0006D5A87D|nr:hypothetical protein [Paenibacillus ihuae]
MENLPRYYVTNEAINSLNEKLGLPKPDKHSQDWVYEVSNSSRVAGFFSFYENAILNMEEKFALMNLVISSYDDAIAEGKVLPGMWNGIRGQLMKHISMYKDLISYWALIDEEDFEDGSAITPYMRDLINR